jgi:8-oxo-dGTP pyrophosphatase MutT (NUDIX family)
MIATSVFEQLVGRAVEDSVRQLAVGAIVQADGMVLLLQRRYNGLNSGILELPTAVVGAGETLPDAVTRAVREKVGLVVADVGEYVGSFDYLSHGGGISRQINFAASVVTAEPVRLCGHYGYRWMPVDSDLPVTRSVREVFRKYRNIRYV